MEVWVDTGFEKGRTLMGKGDVRKAPETSNGIDTMQQAASMDEFADVEVAAFCMPDRNFCFVDGSTWSFSLLEINNMSSKDTLSDL